MVFEEYLKSVEPVIYLISKKCNIPGMDKKDVRQEIRMKLWVSFDKYNEKAERYKTGWVNKVAKNHINNLYKYQNRQKRRILNDYESIENL